MVKVMPGLHDAAGPRVDVVGDLQRGVEGLADAVAAVVAHHAEAEAAGVRLDGRADVADRAPRLDRRDAALQALPRHPHQPLPGLVDLAHQEGGGAVAVHAVEEDGDVEVDDVAVLERPAVGDAVADHLVGRGADRLGEAAVVERARVAAQPDGLVVADARRGRRW